MRLIVYTICVVSGLAIFVLISFGASITAQPSQKEEIIDAIKGFFILFLVMLPIFGRVFGWW